MTFKLNGKRYWFAGWKWQLIPYLRERGLLKSNDTLTVKGVVMAHEEK